MRLTLDEIAAKWFVRPGDVVLDIGTNHGESAALYLERGAAKVIGFEPREAARARIPADVREHGGFELLPFALSDRQGSSPIFTPGRKAAPSSLSREFFLRMRKDGDAPVFRLDQAAHALDGFGRHGVRFLRERGRAGWRLIPLAFQS